jgi:hypothetical protein
MAPVGYRTTKNRRPFCRPPTYLLTTDLTTPAAILLQAYFDRWGMEVNHRDEKEILGVGQAQVWYEHSVSKVPALTVAVYGWLLLAELHCYGSTCTDAYLPLPNWRRGAKRLSCQDLVNPLRQQLPEHPIEFPTPQASPRAQTLVGTAAASRLPRPVQPLLPSRLRAGSRLACVACSRPRFIPRPALPTRRKTPKLQ